MHPAFASRSPPNLAAGLHLHASVGRDWESRRRDASYASLRERQALFVWTASEAAVDPLDDHLSLPGNPDTHTHQSLVRQKERT